MFDWLSQVDLGVIVLFSMFFLHIIADFLVQCNFMATYKQKKNWEPYLKEGPYEYDYLVVLAVHSFSWAFITFLPLLFYTHNATFFVCGLLVNTVIHMFVDNLKCNLHKINLIDDQVCHLAQIVITMILSYWFM